jgi:hypothetical protein
LVFGLFVIVVVTLAASVRLIARGHWSRAFTVWVALLITAVRLAMFFGSRTLYTSDSEYGQIIGYALLILNAVVEMAAAVALTGRHPAPASAVALLIALTSGLLAWLLGLIRGR